MDDPGEGGPSDGEGDLDEQPTAADGTDGGRGGPEFDRALGPMRAHWDDVVDDVEATATDYEDRGWETLVVRPGDVTPLAGEGVDRPGFDVLLPDDEFGELLELADRATFDASDVYATVAEGVVFMMVVLRDTDAETALLFPAYYHRDHDNLDDLRDHVDATGTVQTHLRRLREDRVVSFEYENPELLFPSGDE